MKHLVLINGATNVAGGRLNDGYPRSFFSNQERFEQTKATIQNARERVPGCVIAYTEGSSLEETQKNAYEELCDILILLDEEPEVVAAVAGQNKSLGECTTLYHALEYLDLTEFNFVLKICARNQFDTGFNLSAFSDTGKCYFREFSNSYKKWYSSGFYVIGKNCFDKYRDVLSTSIDYMKRGAIFDMETNLATHFPVEMVVIRNPMGITGTAGGDGKTFSH